MRRLLVVPLALAAALAGGAVRIVQDQCGPFTDVSALYCPYVLEAYFTGITAGTSPTTFSPDRPITRAQSAVFTTKALHQALSRGSRRAALGQWWTTTPHWDMGLGTTAVGSLPFAVAADGEDLWVTCVGDGSVQRVHASDGRVTGTWPGAPNALGLLVAMGRVFFTTNYPPEVLHMIDPSQPPGSFTDVSSFVGPGSYGLAFDGARIWVTSFGGGMSIVTPGPTTPWDTRHVTEGFQFPTSVLWDGNNVWVGDQGLNALLRLDADGAILQTVALGAQPGVMAFDGENIWVPVGAGTDLPSGVEVVRASTGDVLATFPKGPNQDTGTAAFDGQRVLVTDPVSDSVYLWRAADLSFIGRFSAPQFSFPLGVASDGVSFWVTLNQASMLARF